MASLIRRRTRSVMLVLMIAVSLWGLLFMGGIYKGMIEQMINNAILSDSGHISLFASGYRLNPDLSRWIDDPMELDDFLSMDMRVRSYVKRLKQEGLAATAHSARGVQILGINIDREEKHRRLSDDLYQGDLNFGRKGRGAIIGFKLADRLQAGIGKKIILSAQDSQEKISSMPFRITGILRTNNMTLDENAVFIAEEKTRELLSMTTGVSQVAVILHDKMKIPDLEHELQVKFPDLEIYSWDELYPALLQARIMMEGFNMITNFLIFSVAALGIFGVIQVSVLERLREFGIMLAIGTSFSQIRNIIFIESFILGFIGFASGAMAGLATLYYFKIYGLDLSLFAEAFDEFGMDAVTYAVICPGYFITALIAVTLATFLSVLIPLRVLKKTKPITVINTI